MENKNLTGDWIKVLVKTNTSQYFIPLRLQYLKKEALLRCFVALSLQHSTHICKRYFILVHPTFNTDHSWFTTHRESIQSELISPGYDVTSFKFTINMMTVYPHSRKGTLGILVFDFRCQQNNVMQHYAMHKTAKNEGIYLFDETRGNNSSQSDQMSTTIHIMVAVYYCWFKKC